MANKQLNLWLQLAYSSCIDMQIFAYELLEMHDVFIKQT